MDPSEILFETPWLQVRRTGHWDFVVRPQSDRCVGVLAITDAGEIVLVEQFRHPLGRAAVELPAGIVGDEEEHRGESLETTAARELLEETGFCAARMSPLLESPTSAGLTSEWVHLFLAEGLSRKHAGGGTAAERITVHCVPLTGLDYWLDEQRRVGKAVDFKILAALRAAGK
jgi:ADP-ribose pyrophosphatase